MEHSSLLAFVIEVESAGFTRINDRMWRGPTHPALLDGDYTDSTEMGVYIVDGWPYQPPLLHVPRLAAWHADREMLCIWEDEDNTQRWKTFAGMNARIIEWTIAEANRFETEESARNPEIYWTDGLAGYGLVDLDEIVGRDDVDGQHGEFHFVQLERESKAAGIDILDLRPGGFSPMRPGPRAGVDHRRCRARWYFRDVLDRPPRDLAEFRDLLTDSQRKRLDRDFRDRDLVMAGLLWRNGAGLVCTMLLSVEADGDDRETHALGLRPKGHDELLLRAGPDAPSLATRTVTIIGVGAIGSHSAELLARSGVGELRLHDYDRLWPANLIRHAAPPDAPAGVRKTTVLANHLNNYPGVTAVAATEAMAGPTWHPDRIAELMRGSDLILDATGHGGFAELAARIAADLEVPFVSAALFRAGAVSRVRRQALSTDTPILQRPHLDKYPPMPPLDDEREYAGTETGCLARVHNAPPVSVVTSASTAAAVAIDALCQRYDYPDETIDVIQAGDEEPFRHVGRLRPTDLPTTIDVAESTLQTIVEAAQRSAPHETGGILVGTTIGGRTTISANIEIDDDEATEASYRIAEGVVADAVKNARDRDDRLGYVGEWHSHPDGEPLSTTDRAAMMTIAQAEAGSNPLLLLARNTTDGWDIEAFEATASTLRRVDLQECGEIVPPDDNESTDDQAA